MARRWFAVLTLVGVMVCSAPEIVDAAFDPVKSSICDAAADRAGRAHEVPVEILRALTRTETGRAQGGVLQPWPWTINMEGDGFWFETRDEALAFAIEHHARGARSFDVGCFQINYRWHGEAFDSIEMMFDQAQNADYAARFLLSLKAEGGDWGAAVGKYHSRTPGLAQKYKGRFDRILASLAPHEAIAPEQSEKAPIPSRLVPNEFVRAIDPGTQTALIAGLALQIGSPRHTRMPGGVHLSAFSEGSGLLRPASPLITRR